MRGRGACVLRSRNPLPCVQMPLHGYARAKILSVHLPRDKMHSKMFKATVYEIFRLVRIPLMPQGVEHACSALMVPHRMPV